MREHLASKFLLRQVLKEYDQETQKGLPNQEFLEKQIERLNGLLVYYRAQSIDARLPPRIRARSRDLQQNVMGLINGIKFGISFMLHKDTTLDTEL